MMRMTELPASRESLPRRCISCFYILDHLDSSVCPECGRSFDLNNARTYTQRPPFVGWVYWLPALLLGGVGGGLLWVCLVFSFGYGCATTIVVPISIGVFVGYTATTLPTMKILLALIAIGTAIFSLVSFDLAGGFCAAVIGVLAMVPVLFGVGMGTLLRYALKQSAFSQRDYLRTLLVFGIVLGMPTLAAMIEGRHDIHLPVTVTTTTVINAPPITAWHGIQFFEEVRRPVPWLLRLSPSLRPLYTIGHSEKIGDLKTCVYEHGKLIKQITEVEPGKLLAFRVVEQDQIENDGATLLDGSFELRAIDGGSHTEVRLTTRYIPRLAPRFAYQWAESLAVHTLHGHVLAGMKDTAEAVAP
jgi:hypothetical protein